MATTKTANGPGQAAALKDMAEKLLAYRKLDAELTKYEEEIIPALRAKRDAIVKEWIDKYGPKTFQAGKAGQIMTPMKRTIVAKREVGTKGEPGYVPAVTKDSYYFRVQGDATIPVIDV